MLPSESQATSVGWRNISSIAGSGGSGCSHGPVSSSADSLRRPNVQTTRPAWLNLMIMSEPLSTAQMLSSLSMRTVCANDQPYRPAPISRMNCPLGPNSSSCAAAGPNAGPCALFERVNTKTWPFESTATPETSPKFNPAGSFRNSGTDWNGSVGTVSWPNTIAPMSAHNTRIRAVIEASYQTIRWSRNRKRLLEGNQGGNRPPRHGVPDWVE